MTAPLGGIVHYLFHADASTQGVCYLQDLFIDGAIRRSGCGRRLTEAVAAEACETRLLAALLDDQGGCGGDPGTPLRCFPCGMRLFFGFSRLAPLLFRE
jgi:hypothetical protein